MTKPIATAIVRPVYGSYSQEPVKVEIRKSGARRCTAQFYAPGWRPMAFTTTEAARAKMERHPGFVAWA